jgi:chromosome segregation ATPase
MENGDIPEPEQFKRSRRRFNATPFTCVPIPSTSAAFQAQLHLIKATVIKQWRTDSHSSRWAACCKTILRRKVGNLGHNEEEIMDFQDIMEKHQMTNKEQLVDWIAVQCRLEAGDEVVIPMINMRHGRYERQIAQDDGIIQTETQEEERLLANVEFMNSEEARILKEKAARADELETELTRVKEELTHAKEEATMLKTGLTRSKKKLDDVKEDYERLKERFDGYRMTFNTALELANEKTQVVTMQKDLMMQQNDLEINKLRMKITEQATLLAKRHPPYPSFHSRQEASFKETQDDHPGDRVCRELDQVKVYRHY